MVGIISTGYGLYSTVEYGRYSTVRDVIGTVHCSIWSVQQYGIWSIRYTVEYGPYITVRDMIGTLCMEYCLFSTVLNIVCTVHYGILSVQYSMEYIGTVHNRILSVQYSMKYNGTVHNRILSVEYSMKYIGTVNKNIAGTVQFEILLVQYRTRNGQYSTLLSMKKKLFKFEVTTYVIHFLY